MKAVESYQGAIRALLAARERLRSIVKTTTSVAGHLKGWETAAPESINGKLNQAIEDWPTPERLASAIRQWKEAAKAVGVAWDAIPNDQRLCLTPPEAIPFAEMEKDAAS